MYLEVTANHDEVVGLDVRVDNASAVDELHCFQHLYHDHENNNYC